MKWASEGGARGIKEIGPGNKEEEGFGVLEGDASALGALLLVLILSSPEGVELFLVEFMITGDEGARQPCAFTGEGDGKMSCMEVRSVFLLPS